MTGFRAPELYRALEAVIAIEPAEGSVGQVALAARDGVARFADDLFGLAAHLREGLTLIRTCSGADTITWAIANVALVTAAS